MKAKVLFILIVFSSLSLTAQRGVRIGYIDMEYILENVEEYQEANAQLDKKVQKWKVEIEQKQAEVEQMRKDLMAEKVLLTKELIEEREAEIQLKEKDMLEYQQDRFGPQGDLVIQRRQLTQPVQDQVFNAVQDIAANRSYDFIFDRSADVVMLYSNKRHDISDQVLRRINATRKQTERKEKAAGKSAKDQFEEVNPEVEARKKAAQEKREAQAKALEEKRQQKLEDREARKKAYEERRRKLLEEREAKKRQQETETVKDSINN